MGKVCSAEFQGTGNKGVNYTDFPVRRSEPKAPSPLPSMKMASINQRYLLAREMATQRLDWTFLSGLQVQGETGHRAGLSFAI